MSDIRKITLATIIATSLVLFFCFVMLHCTVGPNLKDVRMKACLRDQRGLLRPGTIIATSVLDNGQKVGLFRPDDYPPDGRHDMWVSMNSVLINCGLPVLGGPMQEAPKEDDGRFEDK